MNTKEIRGDGTVLDALRAMRVYQWSKNFLVFAPVFLSHTIFQVPRFLHAAEAFLAFSTAASALYIVNDLLDIEADRQHPRKRFRPFAQGRLSIGQGRVMAAVMFAITAGISALLPLQAGMGIALYVVTGLLYSFYLKRLLFVDVITLASLYTLRLLVGGVATAVTISPWTLAFSIFVFTSLAICKRLSELRAYDLQQNPLLPARAYSQNDLVSLTSLSSSSGYAAVVVLALYFNSPEVMVLYQHPRVMWLLLPLLTYWISRAIVIANRGEMHHDPIVFAFGDPASWVAGLLTLAIVVGAL